SPRVLATIKANARERGRVHTIGAAFDALRRSVPVSNECKLSKLSILRIAASYIETLTACIEAYPNGDDKPEDLSCNKTRPPVVPTATAAGGNVAMAYFNQCSLKLVTRIRRELKPNFYLEVNNRIVFAKILK
ncbi:unnamed protein product, partial [Mesocestoides corti]